MADRGWRTGHPWCIAHRGGAAEAEENTLDAFARAARLGVDMVELDARLAADGAPVVCHDPTLARTHGRADVVVAARPAEALAVHGVPGLDAALDACAPLPVTVELKEAGALPAAVAASVLARGDAERVLVGGFGDAALAAFVAAAPSVATSLGEAAATALVRAALAADEVPALPSSAVALQVPVRHEGIEVVTPPVVALAHDLGLAVHVWTVDAPAEVRRLVALGVDGVITDRPALVRDVLTGLQA